MSGDSLTALGLRLPSSPMLPARASLEVGRQPRVPGPVAPGSAADKERLTKAAQEFEGMLMEQLMQGMRKTVEPSGLFGQEGQSKSTFEYLLDQSVIAKAIKGGKGMGLAAHMERVWANRTATITPVQK